VQSDISGIQVSYAARRNVPFREHHPHTKIRAVGELLGIDQDRVGCPKVMQIASDFQTHHYEDLPDGTTVYVSGMALLVQDN
jgi:hypothetical protein